VQAAAARCECIRPSSTAEPDEQTSAARSRTTATINRRPDLQVARIIQALVETL